MNDYAFHDIALYIILLTLFYSFPYLFVSKIGHPIAKISRKLFINSYYLYTRYCTEWYVFNGITNDDSTESLITPINRMWWPWWQPWWSRTSNGIIHIEIVCMYTKYMCYRHKLTIRRLLLRIMTGQESPVQLSHLG